MIELKEKRNLTSKTFQNENSFTLESHVGHIHYFNKLGIGNSINDFRSVDWTLNFDTVKRGWAFKYHSFQPFLPEFADDWVEFRDLFNDKDQTIRYKAKCEHIKGRLVMPSEIGIQDSLVNCVIYDNAFGVGLDYVLYFTRSTLKKVVRIRDGYKQKIDMLFTWDIDLPNKDIFRTYKREDVENDLKKGAFKETPNVYKFDKTRSKIFDSPKQLLIGNTQLDEKEWFTYIKSFKCWDSSTTKINTQIISVNYDAIQNTITKIIPKTFLDISEGDVFTDTTTSYYAGAGDGYVDDNYTNQTWNTYVTNASGPTVSYTSAYTVGEGLGTMKDGSTNARFGLNRSFYPMDTSGLTTGATISAATMNIVSHFNDAGNNALFAVVQGNQASTSTLTGTDYGGIGSTEGCTRTSAATVDTYTTFTLNATGLGWISKTGYTKLGVREAHDLDNSAPANSTYYRSWPYYSEQTGTSNDPYLSVTYTISSSVTAGFFTGYISQQ